MIDPGKASQRTKQIALLIVFTALYIVLRFIPFSMLIGGAGGYLSLSDFLAPIFGIILGPYFGGLSVLIGSFGALSLGRSPQFLSLYFLDFLPDFVAVVSVGFLFRRKWLPVVAINAALLVAFSLWPLTSFFVTIPGTSIVIPFAWLHIAAFIVLLSPLGRWAPKWIQSAKQTKSIAAGLAIMALIGTMMQHLMGNILFEVAFGQIGIKPFFESSAWPGIWTGVMLVYPVERTILIICTVLVGTPVIWSITKNHFLQLGKQSNSPSETLPSSKPSAKLDAQASQIETNELKQNLQKKAPS